MINTNTIMLRVFFALIPAFLVKVYFWGVNSLYLLLVAIATSLIIEAISSYLRKKPLSTEIRNNSGIVTCMLLVLSLPPQTPWFATCICTLVAILVAKQFYGGMGQNIFNPAMVGMAVFLVTYPQFFTYWQLPNVGDTYSSPLAGIMGVNATTGATPLVEYKLESYPELAYQGIFYGFADLPSGFKSEYLAFFIYNLMFILGGIYLLLLKIIKPLLPLVTLGAFVLMGYAHYLFTGDFVGLPQYSLVFGSICIGAFFIVTDPVTSPQYGLGKVIFALMIGVLAYIIRTWSNYNDGIAFAVLLANLFVPLLDQYFRPAEYGK